MSIVDFIAVVSFGLTCFGIGYSFGKNVKVEDKAVVTGNVRVQNARKEIIREENEKAQTE